MDRRESPPIISVVVPVFNSAWCIERCLRSLISEQHSVPMEVIVVDDGSVDGTEEILDRLAGQITVLRQGNAGPGAARNAGIQASKGSLVAFMDSDDELVQGRLAMQLEYMANHPEIVLSFGSIVFRSRPDEPYLSTLTPRDEWTVMPDPYRHLLTAGGECVITVTAMARRECLTRVGGFDSRFRCGEDTDLMGPLG